jgi:hypothetical protein
LIKPNHVSSFDTNCNAHVSKNDTDIRRQSYGSHDLKQALLPQSPGLTGLIMRHADDGSHAEIYTATVEARNIVVTVKAIPSPQSWTA